MEYALPGVVAVATIVAVAAFSRRLGVAAPIVLVLVGVAASLLPGFPEVEVPHELILTVVLPPLLYSAAITVPITEFRRNMRSITALSVLLVLVSAFATGGLLFLLLPDLDLAAAIALGAVIAPPDAVAATSIGRRLGLPSRLLSILEGEGLVNDATALVLLRSAIAATGAAVSFWGVAGDFVVAVVVAVVIGLLVGIVTVAVRRRLDDPVLDIAVSFAVPFVAFIPTEALGASGVLAVVAAGLYSGHRSASSLSAQSRINERLNWRTVQFILENGVFLLIGVELSTILAEVEESGLSVGQGVLLGLLMTLVLVAVRFVFIAPLLLVLRRHARRAERRHSRFGEMLGRLTDRTRRGPGASRPVDEERWNRRREQFERRYEQSANDLRELRAQGLGWRGGVVLGWSGMRGVVTLAAAQSLPSETPYRAELVLIALTVAIVTLVVQGGTLPAVIRLVGVRGTDAEAERRELAGLLEELAQEGVGVLDDPQVTGDGADAEVLDRVRQDTLARASSARELADEQTLEQGPHAYYREMRLAVLRAEREALLDARSAGAYSAEVLRRAQALLDVEETRIAQLDD